MLYERLAGLSFAGANIEEITGLRIVFDVDKLGGQFNHGIVRVYNLNPDSRNELARTIPVDGRVRNPITTTLRAGYADNVVQVLQGDILETRNYQAGPDWVTEMDIYSGLYGAKKAEAKVSYNGKTSSKKILEDILEPLKVDIRYTEDARRALQGQTMPYYSAAGMSYHEANLFLSRYKLEFTIEEHNLGLVYKKDSPRDKQAARNNLNTFTKDNGLVGTPRITSSGVEFRALLRPQIKILQRIFVESESIKSTLHNDRVRSAEYFVTQIKHIGDTRSDEWYTMITGAYAGL